MEKPVSAERRNQLLNLEKFLTQCPPGAIITYGDIEQATHVAMDLKGKHLLRSALWALDLEYLCQRGRGIELAGAQSAVQILETRFVRIDSSVKRAEVSHTRLETFVPALSAQDKKTMAFIASTFGAIRLAADHLRAKTMRQRLQKQGIRAPVHESISHPALTR